MKKLLAGVATLVTVSATGCFGIGIGIAAADDTPIGGPPTPGAPGDQTAYALGGAHVLGIPYDKYSQGGLFPIAYTKGTDFRPANRLPAESLTHWNSW